MKLIPMLSEKEIAEAFATLGLDTEEKRKAVRFAPREQLGFSIHVVNSISQPISLQTSTEENNA